jgi:hypothetical protein
MSYERICNSWALLYKTAALPTELRWLENFYYRPGAGASRPWGGNRVLNRSGEGRQQIRCKAGTDSVFRAFCEKRLSVHGLPCEIRSVIVVPPKRLSTRGNKAG